MNNLKLALLVSSVSAYNVPPKFMKEAEIKHGRVAMVSSLVIPFLDNVNSDVLGVNYVSSLDAGTQQLLLAVFGVSEFFQLSKAYEFPYNRSTWFKIKEDHVPGDYNFDPLGILEKKGTNSTKDLELNHGRLAMLAVIGQMVYELSTNEPVFTA
tara:strand:- start:64 stop:525 length:462 start_codon:yes stop_codon:yes gene_type:complete